MRIRITFFIVFALAMAGSLSAQTKTVTNASLATYKDDRARATQEYLENYERLGMPSPDEIERRKDESRAEMNELARQMRAENLERQRLAAELLMNARLTEAYNRSMQIESPQFRDRYPIESGIYLGNPYRGGRRHHRFGFRRPFGQSGYAGGGMFWPSGPRTPSQPLLTPTRR
ncbi:MAG: hypothetical protein ACKVRN_17115 [Pyrinomonadaceae bacterium]